MNDLQLASVLFSFIIVYALIILRGTRRLSIPVWVSMALGAILMLLTGGITPQDAYNAIDLRVIGFLFGMFSIVTAMELSGLLRRLAERVLSFSKTPQRTIATTVLASGLLSSILVNDTIALLWTPVVIGVAAQLEVDATPLLLALAFGITIGSVMTPIGNPQNLLVAENSKMASPMTNFLIVLGPPTLVNLLITVAVLSFFYSSRMKQNSRETERQNASRNTKPQSNTLSRIALLAMAVAVAGFLLSSFMSLDFLGPETGLTTVALLSGAIVYLFSSQRMRILRRLEWSILVFFASMFVLMRGVWDSGIGPSLLHSFGEPSAQNLPGSIFIVLTASTILSQVLSNVPFVQLYSQVLLSHGITAGDGRIWLALAAGSTVAGNLTVLGAASNIIIIEAAERRGVHAFSFLQFLKVGTLVTILNLLVYFFFLLIM